MTKEIIINGIDISECEFLWKEKLPKKVCNNGNLDCNCNSNPNCYFKQLKRQQYYLEKIRAYELNSLDVDWDEYEQHACDTEYSPIVDFVELALGEKEDE